MGHVAVVAVAVAVAVAVVGDEVVGDVAATAQKQQAVGVPWRPATRESNELVLMRCRTVTCATCCHW